jgi:hypothetical protein
LRKRTGFSSGVVDLLSIGNQPAWIIDQDLTAFAFDNQTFVLGVCRAHFWGMQAVLYLVNSGLSEHQ